MVERGPWAEAFMVVRGLAVCNCGRMSVRRLLAHVLAEHGTDRKGRGAGL